MITTPIETEDERAGLPSASAMERFISCPGSTAAQKNQPPLPPKLVTTQGTDIHRAMETGDATGMAETEQEIAVRLERLERKAVALWAEQNDLTPHEMSQLSAVREERLWMRNRATLEQVASAKLDVYYQVRNLALIIDFKSGFKEATPSERNWQLLTQAVCHNHNHPEVEGYTLAIAASRLSSSLDITRYTATGLRHAEFVIQTALWSSQQPNAARVPGSWCQYCRANGVCPSAAAFACIQFSRTETIKGGLSIYTEVQNMTPEQMKFVWLNAPVAREILDAVQARLEHLPPEVLGLIGLALKDGAEVRKITDVSAARERLSQILTGQQIDQCSSLALGKLEAAVKQPEMTKKAAAALVEETLSGLVEKKRNKPSLVLTPIIK